MTIDTKLLLSQYVDKFNSDDEEIYSPDIPNNASKEWMLENIPRITLPDKSIEKTYYFRWWTYRKHIKHTPEGYIITEFLPNVNWAGDYNTIPCAVGHHLREGRWLKNNSFLDDYINFWLNDRLDQLHRYSNWFEFGIESLAKIRGDDTGLDIVDKLIQNLQKWYDEQLTSKGLFWSNDGNDGSEFSITGPGLRLTLNCYIYAANNVIASFLDRKGDFSKANIFRLRSKELQSNLEQLWDEEKRFYIPLSQPFMGSDYLTSDIYRARELFGYLPWMFGCAKEGRTDTFKQLFNTDGFKGNVATTFAEQRHPGYGIFYTGAELNKWLISRDDKPIGPDGHECLWNGPSWPFATSLAITAFGNMLTSDEKQTFFNSYDYLTLLHNYAECHSIKLQDGRQLPWIDENINPNNGDWIARSRLSNWNNKHFPIELGGYERGKDYNHSVFCDLVLEGLFGIRPEYKKLIIDPLFPADWEYAVAENITVHGEDLKINYSLEQGYTVTINNVIKFNSKFPCKCILDYD